MTQVRFLRFLAVGGGAATVQFAALWVFKRWVDADLAFSFSYCCSASTHYLCNRFWALPSDRCDVSQQLGEYLGTVVLSYLVNLGVFKLAQAQFGLGVMWAAFWAIPPSTLLVFALLNYRVFRLRRNGIKD